MVPALEGRALKVSYGARNVLDGLSVSIQAGGVTVLCGPNGCGKSTLLRSLAGLQQLSGGEVLVEGRKLGILARKERARALAILSQANEAPPGLTVGELVAYGRYAHRSMIGGLSETDRAAIAEAIEAAGLSTQAERPLGALSGGERQRAWIAMTLAQQCRILLLDEPTTWLDIRHQVELVSALKTLNASRRMTIVCVLHDLNQAAAMADRILLMKDGRILHDGTPAAILTPDHLRTTFGVEMQRIDHPTSPVPVCLPNFGAATLPGLATRP